MITRTVRRTYYKTCPYCGSNLDPCEQCDCEQNKQGYNITSKQVIKRSNKSKTRKEALTYERN